MGIEATGQPRRTQGARHPGAPLWALVWATALGAVLFFGVGVVAAVPFRASTRPELERRPALLQRVQEAYRSGRWDEARRAVDALLEENPGHARALDYRDRLDLIALEAAALARAEEALAGGRGREAARLAKTVPPNSPLFAQADALLRAVDPPASASAGAVGTGQALAGEQAVLPLGGVLQQADALYREGQFAAAATRAEELAEQADGAARRALLRWAERCRRLGELFGRLGGAGPEAKPIPLGGATLGLATEAITLDRALGGTHARTLRPRVVAAYSTLIEADWERAGMVAACERWVEGLTWESRVEAWEPWPARCRARAQAELRRAQAVRARPKVSRVHYEAVLALVPEGDPLHTEALQALAQDPSTRSMVSSKSPNSKGLSRKASAP